MEGAPEEILTQRDALQSVQLDVPEIVQFLSAFEEKIGVKMPFHNQTIEELALEIRKIIKGVEEK